MYEKESHHNLELRLTSEQYSLETAHMHESLGADTSYVNARSSRSQEESFEMKMLGTSELQQQ